MPSKKDMLKDDIEIRWKILIITKEILKFWASFEKPSTQLERFYMSRDKHLTFLGWSLWRLLIIELSKLFSDSGNQSYNLLKLLRKLGKAGDYRSLQFDEKTLNSLQEKTNQLQIAINEITRLRNGFYAHADSDPFEKIKTALTTGDCEKLIDLAEEIIRTVADRLTEVDYIVYPLYYNSKNFDLIYNLAYYEQEEYRKIADQQGMSFKDLVGHEPLS